MKEKVQLFYVFMPSTMLVFFFGRIGQAKREFLSTKAKGVRE